MTKWMGVCCALMLSACAGSYDAVVSTGQIGEQLAHRTHSITLDQYVCEATYLVEQPARTEESPPYPGDCDKVRPASRGVALQIGALAAYGEALQSVARGAGVEDQHAVLFAELAMLDTKGFEVSVSQGTKKAIELGELLTRNWTTGEEGLTDLIRLGQPIVAPLCDKLTTYLTLQNKRNAQLATRMKARAATLAEEGRGKQDLGEKERFQDAARVQLLHYMVLQERQQHVDGLIRSIGAFSKAHQLLNTNRETLGQTEADQKLVGEIGSAVRTSFKKEKK